VFLEKKEACKTKQIKVFAVQNKFPIARLERYFQNFRWSNAGGVAFFPALPEAKA
jgi:hypothetical protein